MAKSATDTRRMPEPRAVRVPEVSAGNRQAVMQLLDPRPQDMIGVMAAQQKHSVGDWAHPGSSVINDDKWQEWYGSKGQNSEDGQLHAQMVVAIDNYLNQPLIRDDRGNEVTPLQHMIDYLQNDPNLSAMGNEELQAAILANARANIAGLPPVENKFGIAPDSNIVLEVVGSTIGSMRYSADPQGGGEFAPVKQSEYQEWKQKDPLNARFMVTEAGQRNLDRERAANLFRTFQSGEHAPDFANFAGQVLATLGAPFDADTNYLLQAGGRLRDATPAGRMRESMYWHGRGAPAGTNTWAGNRQFTDTFSGAKYPGFSSTTLPGVGRHFSQSDFVAGATAVPFKTFLQHMTELGGEDQDAITRALFYGNRVTPQMADDGDPEKYKELVQNVNNRMSQNEGWLSAQYPRLTNSVNQLVGSQVLQPDYLSPAADTAGNMPRWFMEDLPTVAMTGFNLGKTVATGVMQGGAKTLIPSLVKFGKHMSKEFAEELPGEMAIEQSVNPMSGSPFMPASSNSWMGAKKDRPWEPVGANDPDYEAKYQGVIEDRKKGMQQIRDRQYLFPR